MRGRGPKGEHDSKLGDSARSRKARLRFAEGFFTANALQAIDLAPGHAPCPEIAVMF